MGTGGSSTRNYGYKGGTGGRKLVIMATRRSSKFYHYGYMDLSKLVVTGTGFSDLYKDQVLVEDRRMVMGSIARWVGPGPFCEEFII